MRIRSGLIVLTLLLGAALPLFGQNAASAPGTGDSAPEIAKVPFGVGESLTYKVKFGPLDVGEAEMRVIGIETVSGHSTYRIQFSIKGGTFFYKIDDKQESWLDIALLASRRYIQNLHQGDYERFRQYEFDLEKRVYHRNDGETGSIPEYALDEASFIYYVRSVPLEVGETYQWDRYYRFDRNPVVLHVLRRERVKVPAGEFDTIVVRPIIKTRGIYSEGGEAEVFFTDDERRLPVQLRSKFKLGSLYLELTDFELGEKLTADMLAQGEP